MGPITVSRAPEGFVGCGILDFYGVARGPEPVGADQTARTRKIKKSKTKNIVVCVCFLPLFLISYGLGTPPTTIQTEDSASNEPLGSSGDCKRTQFSGGGAHGGYAGGRFSIGL